MSRKGERQIGSRKVNYEWSQSHHWWRRWRRVIERNSASRIPWIREEHGYIQTSKTPSSCFSLCWLFFGEGSRFLAVHSAELKFFRNQSRKRAQALALAHMPPATIDGRPVISLFFPLPQRFGVRGMRNNITRFSDSFLFTRNCFSTSECESMIMFHVAFFLHLGKSWRQRFLIPCFLFGKYLSRVIWYCSALYFVHLTSVHF